MTTNTELLASFPEINPANYTDDDVNALNAWGIAAHSAIEALEAEVERLTALYENSTAAHEETVGRAMRAEAQLAAAQGQRDQIADCMEAAYDDSKPLMELMKEAQAIVESKQVFKKFVRGTPLENDIAIWMAEFAKEKLLAAPIPQQPASLLALLTTRSILIQLYEKLGGVIKSSTPISREIEPWPRVSITEESLCDLRKIWESLPEMQEDLMRHVEATPQPKETK